MGHPLARWCSAEYLLRLRAVWFILGAGCSMASAAFGIWLAKVAGI